jgi:hypothetical protein
MQLTLKGFVITFGISTDLFSIKSIKIPQKTCLRKFFSLSERRRSQKKFRRSVINFKPILFIIIKLKAKFNISSFTFTYRMPSYKVVLFGFKYRYKASKKSNKNIPKCFFWVFVPVQIPQFLAHCHRSKAHLLMEISAFWKKPLKN